MVNDQDAKDIARDLRRAGVTPDQIHPFVVSIKEAEARMLQRVGLEAQVAYLLEVIHDESILRQVLSANLLINKDKT